MQLFGSSTVKDRSAHVFRSLAVGIMASLLLIFVPVAPAHAAPGDPLGSDSVLVSGWLARTLAATNNLALTPTGDTDYASTAYALIGLRAAGQAGDQVISSALAMASSGDAFIGDPSQTGQKASAISLMILALIAGNQDPTEYAGSSGTRNLYTDLESDIHDDGSIGDSPSAYSQAFAILALLSSPDGVPDPVLHWLEQQPCTNVSSPGYGGYGFSGPGSCSDVDPDSTAMAVIALIAAGVSADTVSSSGTYLLSVQDSSGGFTSPMSSVNANTTGLAVAALNAIGGMPADKINRATAYLDSLVYTCDLAGDTGTSPVVGAMAYDSGSRASNQINPLAPDVQASLFQASAQGIFGFVENITVPTNYEPPRSATPDIASSCSTGTEAPPAPPSHGIAAGWWWAIGGVVVLAAVVVLGWRLIVIRRKTEQSPEHPDKQVRPPLPD
ncbi:MAG: hypothetical protein FWF25_08425 [Propionibacteriaceae bacterium]|nr:hypothetical protein [Propionibacteriaceae bacterium]